MKVIKLTGREAAVLRAVESTGSTGSEIIERTQILPEEMADIVNGLSEIGYLESYRPGSALPSMDPTPAAEVRACRFEINPSYAQDLKRALQR